MYENSISRQKDFLFQATAGDSVGKHPPAATACASQATSLCYSPFLPNKCDIQLISLQVFSGVAHNLIKSIFEQVISSDN